MQPAFTGWDADGGYAAYATAPAAYAYRIPERLDPLEAAPLLCAGIIGLRALRRSGIRAGGRLGIYGFGASAHLTAQIALREGAEVHVLTRGAEARRLALDLGAASAGAADAAPPVPLDAAILFAPAGELVPVGLEALDRGGTLVLAGIHVSDIPPPRLPAAPVLREAPDLGDGQHAGRRGRAVPARRVTAPDRPGERVPVRVGRRGTRGPVAGAGHRRRGPPGRLTHGSVTPLRAG